MVDIDRIEDEQMTPDEVLDRFTERPMDTVEWLPEWDDNPDALPGENTRIDDETLIWENGEFEIRMESHETTHWLADISVPEAVGEHYPRPIDMKCRPEPEYGFIRDVEQDGYVTVGVELVIAENYMPIYELNSFVDGLRDGAEQSQEFMDDLEAGLDVARENEEALKAQREPGPAADGGLICPECKEKVQHVRDGDDGFMCPNCAASVDEYVEDRRKETE